VAFGNVLGDDRKMLRSRSGDSVKLVDLLDEAIERADAAIAEKNPDLDGDERAEVARMVGIGAVKYADLSTDRVKDYVFDLDRMVSFDGNTGPYLQYAHARICSIFRRAGIDRASVRGLPITLDAPQERALALRLLAYPTAIDTTLETYSPHKLCTYVYDLATDFTAFYEHCPVLKADEPLRSSRLALATSPRARSPTRSACSASTPRSRCEPPSPTPCCVGSGWGGSPESARKRGGRGCGSSGDVTRIRTQTVVAGWSTARLLPDTASVGHDGWLTIGGCRSRSSPRSTAPRCSSTTSSTCAPAAARRSPRSGPSA
jgi:hypothetical protein